MAGNVASTTLCCERRGENRHTMGWITWRPNVDEPKQLDGGVGATHDNPCDAQALCLGGDQHVLQAPLDVAPQHTRDVQPPHDFLSEEEKQRAAQGTL